MYIILLVHPADVNLINGTQVKRIGEENSPHLSAVNNYLNLQILKLNNEHNTQNIEFKRYTIIFDTATHLNNYSRMPAYSR